MNAKLKLLGLLLGALLNIGAAQAATLYASAENGNIYTIDTITYTVNTLGSTGYGAMTDLAFNGGQLYGVSFDSLYTVNHSTGAASLIGSTGLVDLNALETGSNGKLYTAGYFAGSLYTLNSVTAAATLVGNTGQGSDGDLAVGNGTMYYAANDKLWSVNQANASVTLIGSFTPGFGNVYGLAFADGKLFGLTDAGKLLHINTSNGSATLLANVGFSGWGLTAAPVPVPGAIWLFGTAILGWLGFGRRKVAG